MRCERGKLRDYGVIVSANQSHRSCVALFFVIQIDFRGILLISFTFSMGKNRDVSSHIVAQIVTLRAPGLTQVVERFGVCETCLFETKRRSGKSWCTTSRTDKMIKRIATTIPTATFSFIQAQLPLKGVPSTSTINRRFADKLKLKAYRRAAKPMLSAKKFERSSRILQSI